MIREAVKGDEALIEGYLAKHFATCMFMRSNLQDFGIGNKVAQYAMKFIIREEAGEVTGIGGVGLGGALMLQAKHNLPEIVAQMRAAVSLGFKPLVSTGAPEMVAAIIAGFALETAPTQMNDIEPLFLLKKSEIKPQDMRGFSLRRSTMDDLPLLANWNHAYGLEVLGDEDTVANRKETDRAAKSTIERGNQRLLIKQGKVVAQTNFNAVITDAVQIGGVYTPPCERGRGFARRAVAAHLAEAFAGKIKHAILFSASEPASTAYRAIGFERIGEYQIVLFGSEA